jgi:hypothetical protein
MKESNMSDDDLRDELEAAIYGAYEAAPQGEGVAGAMYFAALAAFNVAKLGMKAPEAVAKAIGERGMYGVPRRYALVPREATPAIRKCGFSAHSHDKDWSEIWKLMVVEGEKGND